MYLGDDDVRRLTNYAVFVADSIGLSQPIPVDAPDREERMGVLWCLSNITSAVHVNNRHYPHFPASYRPRPYGTEDGTIRYRDAKYELASIAERIRVELYSLPKTADPAMASAESTSKLGLQMQKCREDHFASDEGAGSPETEGSDINPLRVDRQVSFYSTRILLHWSRSRSSDQDRSCVLGDARKVAGLLLSLWRASPLNAACHAVLTG